MKHRTLLGRTRVSALKRFIYRLPCEPAINYLVSHNDRRNERAKLIQFNTRERARIRYLSLSLRFPPSLTVSLFFSFLAMSKGKQTDCRATYARKRARPAAIKTE